LLFYFTTCSPATTEKVSIADSNALLAAQRLKRPVSPHLTIYKVEQVWLGASIWTRFTGGAFAGALYVYSAAYLAAPLLGWHLESASIAAAFGALPFAVKGGLKFLVSWPFMFHLFNGVRHITYDVGMGFAKSQIKQYGWGIWGASLAAGLYLAFLF
jgi:succinate dehydrogenase (ubiquinone) cytochrome b560 subunit